MAKVCIQPAFIYPPFWQVLSNLAFRFVYLLFRYFRAAIVFDTADWYEDANRVAGLDVSLMICSLTLKDFPKTLKHIYIFTYSTVHKKAGCGPVDTGRWCHLHLAEVFHPQLVSMSLGQPSSLTRVPSA